MGVCEGKEWWWPGLVKVSFACMTLSLSVCVLSKEVHP